MADAKEYQNPNSLKALPVLPHSGKVDQLKREAAESPRPAKPAVIEPAPVAASDSNLPPMEKLIEGKVIAALKLVYDPEIPISIYDLGLIYEIKVDPEANVFIKMTLTAPACPVAGSLPGEVAQRIEAIPEVKSAEVVLVWEPAWSRDRMSEAALLDLGLL